MMAMCPATTLGAQYYDHHLRHIVMMYYIKLQYYYLLPDDGNIYCNSTWDTVSCWPTTLAGQLAQLACPTEFDGIAMHKHGECNRFEIYIKGLSHSISGLVVVGNGVMHEAR